MIMKKKSLKIKINKKIYAWIKLYNAQNLLKQLAYIKIRKIIFVKMIYVKQHHITMINMIKDIENVSSVLVMYLFL